MEPRKALEELVRRQREMSLDSGVIVGIRAELFDKQLNVLDDTHDRIAAVCTRRAGKTSTWPRYATIRALQRPGVLIRIWGITRLRCKQMLWDEFDKLHARHRIRTTQNIQELSIKFANGSEIRLLGADKDREIEKKRGDKTYVEIVLESQLYGPLLRKMVEDIIEPCLADQRGTLILEGTPGPVKAGFWYWTTGGESVLHRWTSEGMHVKSGSEQQTELVGKGWSCHHWSVLDNPFLDRWRGSPTWRQEAEEFLADLRRKRGWTVESPTYVREYLGRWAQDEGSLFYKYSPARNDYDPTSINPTAPGWKHVLGWDLGSRDDMALFVWSWHSSSRNLYQTFEWKQPGATSDKVMARIEALEARGFEFLAKVADTGGGGRMYVEDVMKRYAQTFVAAKKSEKYEHVRLMNDDFQSGFLKVMQGSQYAEELAALPKDPDWDPDSGRPPSEDSRFPNHLCFVAGTLVTTDAGQVPIESVRAGDKVLTRGGYRRVLVAQSTGVRPVMTRIGLTGTYEHPVWTAEGWKRLDELRDSDAVLYAWKELSNGVVLSGTDTLNPSVERTGYISNEQYAHVPYGFIAPSGRQLTDQSHPAGTSTTSTATPTTTPLRTFGPFRERRTCPSTVESAGRAQRQRSALRALQRLERSQKNGTLLPKGARGTENTLANSQRTHPGTWLSVRSVERLSRLFGTGAFAPHDAQCGGTLASDEGQESTTSTACAGNVESNSASASIQSSRTAAVYALSVETDREYFANNVLVSNCDSALYSWRYAFQYLDYEGERGEPEAPQDELLGALEAAAENDAEEWWETDVFETEI